MSVWIARKNVPRTPISDAALQRRALRMLQVLKLRTAELSIVLCDDAEIHRLNRRHRRKDKPTDVLAFAMREGPTLAGAGDLLGDVVISLDTARRQAREHGHSLWAEVTTLLAHGLLHLVGFDHRNDAEEAEMNAQAGILVKAAGTRAASVTRRSVDKQRPRIARNPSRATVKGPGLSKK